MESGTQLALGAVLTSSPTGTCAFLCFGMSSDGDTVRLRFTELSFDRWSSRCEPPSKGRERIVSVYDKMWIRSQGDLAEPPALQWRS